jgi:hypothetical protein
MFKKVLIDAHAIIDLPRNRFDRNMESIAKTMEYEAKELVEFLRDHRSRDNFNITIEREYENICGFCGMKEECDIDGTPVCCQKAIDEYESLKEAKR